MKRLTHPRLPWFAFAAACALLVVAFEVLGGSGDDALPGVESAEAPLRGAQDAGGRLVSAPSALYDRPDSAASGPGLTRVDVRGAPLRTVRALLLDSSSDQAVCGALARLSDGDLEREAQSDASGVFTIEWPEGRPAALEVAHPGFIDMRRAAGDLEGVDVIRMHAAGEITGRVLGWSARGEGGVRLQLWAAIKGRYREDALAEMLSSAAGEFRFTDLRPGAYAVAAQGPGAALVFETGVQVTAGRSTPLQLNLEPALELRVRVEHADTRLPVEGALLSVIPDIQGAGEQLRDQGTCFSDSGPDGRATITGLRLGRHRLYVRLPWGSDHEQEVVLSEHASAPEMTVRVRAPARLAGSVLDGSGRAVAGIRVSCRIVGSGGGWHLSADLGEQAGPPRVGLMTLTDDQGRFDLGRVPSGQELALMASERELQLVAAERSITLKRGEQRRDLVLTMLGAHPIEGVVMDEQRRPLAGVQVSVGLRVGEIPLQWLESTTDDAGGFQFPSVPEGTCQLSFALEGYRTERHKLVVRPGLPSIELNLLAAGGLAGWVQDASGWAVPEARVRLARPVPSRRSAAKNSRHTVRADGFGWFTFEDIDDGTWVLEAWAPGFAMAQGTPFTVQLPASEPIHVQLEVRPDPEPSTVSGEVVFHPSGLPVDHFKLLGVKRGVVSFQGGRFLVQGVPPGRIKWAADGEGIETVRFGAMQLEPGTWLDLGILETRRTCTLIVEVRGADGQPLRDAQVWLDRRVKESLPGVKVPKRIQLEEGRPRGQYATKKVGRYGWQLVVRHEEWQSHEQLLKLVAARERVRVELQPRPAGSVPDQAGSEGSEPEGSSKRARKKNDRRKDG